MNFLSHFYFERNNNDPNLVIGTILPDLIKNAHKDWNLHPQKNEDIYLRDDKLNSLLIGWKKHLEVDIIFHSSAFFLRHTANLKQLLLPILQDSQVRPSFLAHIGVELLLDHLLVNKSIVNVDDFYDQLRRVDDEKLAQFLNKCGKLDTDHFFTFLNSFRSSKYLLSYQKIENISYALQRICMRLWANPFEEKTISDLTEKLMVYKSELAKDYMDIFIEIEGKLS